MPETSDDRRYRMQMEQKKRIAEMEAATAKKATEYNNAMQSGEVSPELEKQLKAEEAERNMDRNMSRDNKMDGGEMQDDEREKYNTGSKVAGLILKALNKNVKKGNDPTRTQVRVAVKEVKAENPELTKKNIGSVEYKTLTNFENYGQGGGGKRDVDSMLTSLLRSDTEGQAATSAPMKNTKTYKKGQMKAAAVSVPAGAIAALGGKEIYDALTAPEESRFQKEFASAQKEGLDVFEFTNDEGKTYPVKVALAAENNSDVTYTKTKKAEGGSMLMPPEMEQDMPVDTYDNIPEDEKEAVEASQLPDAEMEEDYAGFVLEKSLDTEDQEYLMSVLETDERLSSIFDKVMDVAGEFAGEGAVEGPGDGTSDSIPARLSDGEFVFTKKATDQMGADQLQTMMDEAEKAYDGGYMKKAFGGMVDDVPMDERQEDEEINSMMIASNQMPSVRPR